MRVGFVGLCLLLWLGSARGARAEVERGPGAEACPDAVALGPTGDYRVEFVRADNELVARIRDASGAQQRELTSRDLRCEPLARAVRLALALLLDEQPSAPPKPPAAAPLKPPPMPTQEPPVARPLPPADSLASYRLGGGVGVLLGTLRQVAPVLTLEGGLVNYVARLGLVAHVAYAPPKDLGPGRVSTWLAALQVRVCGRVLPQVDVVRLDVCSGLWWGATHARARGYTVDRTRTLSFGAWPLELALGRDLRHGFVELVTSALVALRHSDFVVGNVGKVYESQRIAGFVSLRWSL